LCSASAPLFITDADSERDGSAVGCATKGIFEIATGADAECEIPGSPVCGGGDGGGTISVRGDARLEQLFPASYVVCIV